MLDSLTDKELVKVANGRMRIRIPEKQSPQTVIMGDNDPALMKPIEEMDNNKVITLCKMEIESRLGWLHLAELIEKKNN